MVGAKSLIKPLQIPAGRLVSDPVVASLQEIHDNLLEYSTVLNDRIFGLECNLEQFLANLYSALSKIAPSETLRALVSDSKIMGAGHSDDVILKSSCYNTKVTLKTSLQLDANTLSARPIVVLRTSSKTDKEILG